LPDVGKLHQSVDPEDNQLDQRFVEHQRAFSSINNPQYIDTNLSPYTQRFDENGLNMMNIGIMGHRKNLTIKRRKGTYHNNDTKQSFNHLNYTQDISKSDENT
jgi:hypothetical protein